MEKSSNSVSCMLAASFAATLAIGFPYFSYLYISEPHRETLGTILGGSLFFALLSGFVGFFIASIYGIPVYRILTKFNLANYFTASVMGSLPGLALYFYAATPFNLATIFFGVFTGILFIKFKKNGLFSKNT